MEIRVDNLDFGEIKLIDENGEMQTFNMKDELKVNEGNLMGEMLRQPSKYIYWASVLEKIRMYEEISENKLERTVATIDVDARAAIEATGAKPTKDSVDAYVKRDERYQAAIADYNYYKYISRYLQRVTKAFEQRKDMLQSYGKQIAEQKDYGRGAGSQIEKYHDTDRPFGN